jgi:hypothetical protein
MVNKDIFFNNIELLYDKNYILEIVPTTSMNNSQKINAIIRFSLFFSILLYICTENYLYLYIFLVTVIVTYIIFIFSNKEFFKTETKNDNDNDNDKMIFSNSSKNTDLNVECILPDDNNPLMNPLIGENNNHKKMACSLDNKNIVDMVDKKFNALCMDDTTILNNKYTQRPFYTVPNTANPSDQKTFAKWLYDTPVSCSTGDNGLLKQVRACSFNTKSLSELKNTDT